MGLNVVHPQGSAKAQSREGIEEPLMQDEITAPLLNLVSFQDAQEVVAEFQKQKLFAVSYFGGKNSSNRKNIENSILSEVFVVNDVLVERGNTLTSVSQPNQCGQVKTRGKIGNS